MSLSANYEDDTVTSSVPIAGILFLFLFGASFGHCWWVSDYVAMTSVGVVGAGCLVGYWYGIWRAVGSTVGLWAGVQFAVPASIRLVPWVERQLSYTVPPAYGVFMSGLFVGLCVTVVFWGIGMILFRSSPFLKRCDRYAGFAFGGANAVLLVALPLWGLLASESEIMKMKQTATVSHSENENGPVDMSERLVALLSATKKSYVMRGLERWSPFVDFPIVRDLKTKIQSSIASKPSDGSNGSLIPSGMLEQVLKNLNVPNGQPLPNGVATPGQPQRTPSVEEVERFIQSLERKDSGKIK